MTSKGKLEEKAVLYGYLADFFKILSNPTRLQILQLLKGEGEASNK